MPGSKYASIKRPRVYEALRRKGYSKEQAARIANSRPGKQRKEAAVGPQVVSPTGPGGLFAVPGLQLLRRRKAEGEGERTFVRSDDGKFSETPGGGGGDDAAEPTKKKKPATEKKPAPPPGAPQGADEIDAFLADLGLDPKLSAALGEYLSGQAAEEPEDIALNRAAADALVALGLVEIAPGQEGAGSVSISLTGAGKKLQTAVAKGDIEKGMATVEAAHDRNTKREAKRAAALAKREAKRAAAAEAKKKPAAEGGEGAAAAAPKPAAGGGGGGGPKGPSPAQQAQLEQLLGGRLARALPATKAMRPKRSRAWKAAYAEARTAGHDPATARRRASLALRREDAAKAARHYERAVGRLRVYKAADGSDRWAAISATAYRDSDREIVSREALANALVFAEATDYRGPLRFWHLGAPWGAGCDIGDCDYQALAADGRFLVESGTFRSPAYAAAFKARGDGWQMSIGFSHPEDQPDPSGVFSNIAIFERSVVPPGRAANPFTTITTKESRMLNAEKRKALEALLGKDAAAGLLAQIGETDKTAQQAGVAFKATDPAPTVYTGPDGQPGIIADGRFVALTVATVKAPSPEEMMAAGAAGAAEGAATAAAEDPEAEAEPEEMLLSPAEIDLIADRVVEKLMGAIDEVGQKMAATDEELKMRGYSRMKEMVKETTDPLATDVRALTAALRELTGDIPAGQAARATQTRATTVKADDPTVAAGAQLAGAELAPAAPQTMEQTLVRWMEQNAGGAVPWSIPAAAPGVDPAQHAAPGVRS